MVEEIVVDIEREHGHYPNDIIDSVFLEIENYHKQKYNSWITVPDGSRNDNQVNAYIERLIQRLTGLTMLAYPVKPKSKLIKGYSTLGH